VALRSDSTLTISQIFTAFSIMVLLNSPLTKIVIALPQIAGMITSFQRIQDFINEKEWCDKRTLLNQTQSESAKSEKVPHVDVAVRMQGRFSWSRTTQKVAGDSPEEDSGSTSSSTEVEPVHDLVVSPALEIPRNKVSVVMGPVGCGKSTFLRALLGELSFDGELIMNCGGAAAFSEQDPWMPNETVNEFITGQLGNSDAGNGSEPISGLSYDKDWYRAVVRACQLEKDVNTWPKGDETVLGSKGAAMSGGQKQRLVSLHCPDRSENTLTYYQSLARAIYARRELVLLDDSFSGIDASTEDAMFSSLFGSEGLFRSCNMTVVIAPSSSMNMSPLVDNKVLT
jgi:ABC-type bacteriocin/lantibiotic exporter with double-glycine peptidase domain